MKDLENTIDKCEEYHKMFTLLKEVDNDCYQRIRLYTNGCLGQSTKFMKDGDEITYLAIPKRDIVNLYMELFSLINSKPEYANVSHELYRRMVHIVKCNSDKNERNI